MISAFSRIVQAELKVTTTNLSEMLKLKNSEEDVNIFSDLLSLFCESEE